MPLNPRSNSRFLISDPILTRDGDPTYGIAKKYKFLTKSNLNDKQIGTFVVDADTAGRPDRLADRIYNDPELHWILTIFNRVDNPLNWPLNNQVIEYPTPVTVSAEL